MHDVMVYGACLILNRNLLCYNISQKIFYFKLFLNLFRMDIMRHTLGRAGCYMKEFMKKIISDKKRCVIACTVTVLVLVLTVTGIVTVSLKNNRKRNKDNKNNIVAETVNVKPVQETTAEETTEEQTEETEEETQETEEETQETEEETFQVVEENVVEDFFENEISTEDEEALELPTRKLTSEFIPYDGKKREITCYGDSMMEGVGSDTTGMVNGQSIYGCTAPLMIEKLSHITTHNFGIGGEVSTQITFRAGGIKVYLDRDITISEGKTAIVQLKDEDGKTFTNNIYSGYTNDSDSPGQMYIGGYLCDVKNAGNNQVQINLTKGYAAYDNGDATNIVVYNMETESITNNYSKISVSKEIKVSATEPNMDNIEKIQETTSVQSPTESTTQGTTQGTTEGTTTAPTEKPTQASTIGNVTIKSGTQAKTRASVERSNNDILILEMGSNGGWENDYQQLILQYDDIILNSNCKYYIIVGDTDDPGTSLADDNQGEYNEDGSYVGIGDTAWEAALREAYGKHFFNTRTYMIQNGLADCGLSTTTSDLENFRKGNISKQLRYDWTHFNCYGYYTKGIGIYKKGVELGYWS